jgi:hypothetical protein
MIIAAVALSACDNQVNQNFEQSVNDRKAENAGDPYASLESLMPRLRRYVQTETIQQREFASGQSGQFRATYDNLLSKLDADKEVDRSKALFSSCRAAFSEASRFQSASGNDASAAAAAASDKALAGLRVCRAGAKAAREGGALLARFASTGIVMIGAKVAGQGDADRGVEIWREGEKLVSEDKPDFELSVKSLRGY